MTYAALFAVERRLPPRSMLLETKRNFRVALRRFAPRSLEARSLELRSGLPVHGTLVALPISFDSPQFFIDDNELPKALLEVVVFVAALRELLFEMAHAIAKYGDLASKHDGALAKSFVVRVLFRTQITANDVVLATGGVAHHGDSVGGCRTHACKK